MNTNDVCTCGHKELFCHKRNAQRYCGVAAPTQLDDDQGRVRRIVQTPGFSSAVATGDLVEVRRLLGVPLP